MYRKGWPALLLVDFVCRLPSDEIVGSFAHTKDYGLENRWTEVEGGSRRVSRMAKPITLGVDLERQPKTIRREVSVEMGLFRNPLNAWNTPPSSCCPNGHVAISCQEVSSKCIEKQAPTLATGNHACFRRAGVVPVSFPSHSHKVFSDQKSQWWK